MNRISFEWVFSRIHFRPQWAVERIMVGPKQITRLFTINIMMGSKIYNMLIHPILQFALASWHILLRMWMNNKSWLWYYSLYLRDETRGESAFSIYPNVKHKRIIKYSYWKMVRVFWKLMKSWYTSQINTLTNYNTWIAYILYKFHGLLSLNICHPTDIGIPNTKLIRFYDRLKFIMGIPIPIWQCLFSE